MGVSESSSEGKTLKIKVIDFILKHPDLKPKKIAEKQAEILFQRREAGQ